MWSGSPLKPLCLGTGKCMNIRYCIYSSSHSAQSVLWFLFIYRYFTYFFDVVVHRHVCFILTLNDCVGEAFTSAYKYTIPISHAQTHRAEDAVCVLCGGDVMCVVWPTDPSHVYIVWSAFPTFFILLLCHTTNGSTCSSLLCKMPDGRDQEIRHRGEHMCLAHYLPSSPVLHTPHPAAHAKDWRPFPHQWESLAQWSSCYSVCCPPSFLASCLFLNFNTLSR